MASDKLRESNIDDEKGAEMDMSPMIDLVFLLLVFFIVVSTPMVVIQDPEANPSVAHNAVDVQDKLGRIVINVRADGSFSQEDYSKTMTEETEITDYVQAQIVKMESQGYRKKQAKIHLRGDDKALYKYSQMAVKASSAAGVTKIVFSVFPYAQEKK